MSAGVDVSEADESAHTHTPDLAAAVSIGAALRAAREHKGLALADVADATKVRRAYLEAIEEMRFDELPSRPFAIGYIRAFASLVGIDPNAAVVRFREEFPEQAEPLRAPAGVRRRNDGRLGLIIGIGVIVLASIVVWNVAQRAMSSNAPPPAAVPDSETAISSTAAPLSGETPVAVGAPTAPPAESTTPQAYVTPGLETDKTAATALQTAAAGEAAAPRADAPAVFTPKGRVMGAPAATSTVTLQARKSANLVVSGPDGRVLFAQQLQAGEAYRVPDLKGAVIDVSDPAAFDVYQAGQIHAPLAEAKTPVGRLSD